MLSSSRLFILVKCLAPQINIVYGLANLIVFANNLIFNNVIFPSEAGKRMDMAINLERRVVRERFAQPISLQQRRNIQQNRVITHGDFLHIAPNSPQLLKPLRFVAISMLEYCFEGGKPPSPARLARPSGSLG